MASHRIYLQDAEFEAQSLLVIEGDEAEHAVRVKRLRPGDAVEILNGRGDIAHAKLEDQDSGSGVEEGRGRRSGRACRLRVERVTTVQPVRPALDVCTATPKGQRVDELIEGLCQVGAAAWTPLHAERSIVDPRPSKLERLERLSVEASKQCGRAWRMRINPGIRFAEVRAASSSDRLVIADASGEVFVPRAVESCLLYTSPSPRD